MADREEILADFQACTGIEDVGEAFMHLEETNWNLMEAVYRVLPHGSQELPAARAPDPPVEIMEELGASAMSLDLEPALPSVSTLPYQTPQLVSLSNDFMSGRGRGARTLNFTINYGESRIELKVPENETVEMIKLLVHSELDVPVCRQELSGWNSDRPTRDSMRLSSLNLPRDNVLYLSLRSGGSDEAVRPPQTDDRLKNAAQSYKLSIFDEAHHKLHTVNFPGTKTVRDVKQDISDLTNIPVRHQYWSGWPPQAKDDTILSQSGMNCPIHNLTVNELIKEMNRPVEETAPQAAEEQISDDGSALDEFEDASDTVMEDMFFNDPAPSRPQPLMPDGIEDEAIAAIHFAEGFSLRYGHCHPMFFQGSLDDAMKEAVLQPARDRKLLAVYLHHDGSVSTNVFCTQVLCSESVVSFLTSNFIIWGWDLTLANNRQQLLSTIARHFDSLTSRTLRNFVVDKLPLLLIATRSRSSNEILTIVQGSVNVDEMMTQLLHSVEMFSEQQRIDIVEEDEREAREQVKREQDEAYQASLQADRAKEELRKQGEAEKLRQEQEKRAKEENEKQILMVAQMQKEEQRRLVEQRLPAEPAVESAEASTTIRFRLPGGNTATRRFLACERLQVLFDYLFVEGYPMQDYKVLSSWPRKDLTLLDSTNSLKQLNLVPQETLIIEER